MSSGNDSINSQFGRSNAVTARPSQYLYFKLRRHGLSRYSTRLSDAETGVKANYILLPIRIKASQFIPVSPNVVPTSSSSSMSHIVITGAQGGLQQGAAAPNRIEISQFVKMQKPFSLYIQSLSELRLLLFASPNKINLFENSCHVPDPTEQFHLSLFYWGYPWPSLR